MIAAIVLLVAVSLYRLIPVFCGMGADQPEWLFNFSPMAALCLCGAAFLPRRMAITLPFAALLGTDLILNWHYSQVMPGGLAILNAEFIAKTVAFVAIAAFGWQLRRHTSVGVILPAAIGGTLFFYIVTNTAAWLFEPLYAKSLAGWAQALTTGLPQYPATWIFYRNTFASDIAFTLMFIACMRRTTAREAEPVTAGARW